MNYEQLTMNHELCEESRPMPPVLGDQVAESPPPILLPAQQPHTLST